MVTTLGAPVSRAFFYPLIVEFSTVSDNKKGWGERTPLKSP